LLLQIYIKIFIFPVGLNSIFMGEDGSFGSYGRGWEPWELWEPCGREETKKTAGVACSFLSLYDFGGFDCSVG
jgi:hypothetical protein